MKSSAVNVHAKNKSTLYVANAPGTQLSYPCVTLVFHLLNDKSKNGAVSEGVK